jgi:5-methylcytosine-specific restriction endonuclease McrA
VIYTGPPFVRKPKINKNPIPKRDGKFKSAACRVCNSWFVTLFTDVTCSADCQQAHQKETARKHRASDVGKAAKDRRRARKRDAFVENVYRKQVYERDNYRCQLTLPGCRGIDRKKVGSHPQAPTLDHIIPLAQGGTHEPKNCHTACFYCNCKKSDVGGGEQLLLIG